MINKYEIGEFFTMKKIILWFLLLQKRQLHHITLTALLILIPVTALIAQQIPAMQEQTIPRVGIVLTDEDELAVKTANALSHNQKSVEFYLCDSIEQLQNDILNKDADCGYVFSEGLTAKLDKKSYKGCISLLKSTPGMIPALSSEILFSEMFRIYGKNIVTNYIAKDDLFSELRADAISKAGEQYDYYLNGAATFHINFRTLGQDVTEVSDDLASVADTSSAAAFPVRGILAVILFMSGLLGCIQWLKDSENGVFAPMSYAFIHISRFLYILAPVLLFACSSLLTIYISGVQTGLLHEVIGMVLYTILILAFCILITFFVPKSMILVSLLPVLILGSLILCPVFINMAQFVPIVNIINKLFIPFYYLRMF